MSNSNSISKDFALTLVKELKMVNQEIIKEVTRNNDLINQIIKIYDLNEEEVSNGEFTNTLSKSPNVAYGYTYHEYDEDGCEHHYCEDCAYWDLEEDDEPCNNCSNLSNGDNCYFEPKHDPRPIKSYDEIYEPMSHTYLECHSSNDCEHSISSCKFCKYRAAKSDHVPCVGCNCIHADKPLCFHVYDEN